MKIQTGAQRRNPGIFRNGKSVQITGTFMEVFPTAATVGLIQTLNRYTPLEVVKTVGQSPILVDVADLAGLECVPRKIDARYVAAAKRRLAMPYTEQCDPERELSVTDRFFLTSIFGA